MNGDTDARLDALLRALADPTRRRLLTAIRAEPGLTTAELAAATRGMTRWGVMKHLEVLAAAGLIEALPEGRNRRHYHDPHGLDPLMRWLNDQSRAPSA
jgi:DNA-binding transcriptional ArsR family regulator